MPTITRLAKGHNSRVRVEVDGAAWRTLPATLVESLELRTGSELSRPTLRALRRELRRREAAAHAERILGASDTSRANLARALARRGVAPVERDALLASLSNSGLLSDARASRARAEALCARGYGNLAIELKLESDGYPACDRQEAIASLEGEMSRARDILSRKKRTPQAAARFLTQRGFDPDVCEALCDVYDIEP